MCLPWSPDGAGYASSIPQSSGKELGHSYKCFPKAPTEILLRRSRLAAIKTHANGCGFGLIFAILMLKMACVEAESYPNLENNVGLRESPGLLSSDRIYRPSITPQTLLPRLAVARIGEIEPKQAETFLSPLKQTLSHVSKMSLLAPLR